MAREKSCHLLTFLLPTSDQSENYHTSTRPRRLILTGSVLDYKIKLTRPVKGTPTILRVTNTKLNFLEYSFKIVVIFVGLVLGLIETTIWTIPRGQSIIFHV